MLSRHQIKYFFLLRMKSSIECKKSDLFIFFPLKTILILLLSTLLCITRYSLVHLLNLGMHEHLQIQTQVNAELKNMLIASMGEDIQYKIERLVSDKERLSYEVNTNRDTINKMNEEIEQCSIKCDLWRSKFLACRLMSDEASTW